MDNKKNISENTLITPEENTLTTTSDCVKEEIISSEQTPISSSEVLRENDYNLPTDETKIDEEDNLPIDDSSVSDTSSEQYPELETLEDYYDETEAFISEDPNTVSNIDISEPNDKDTEPDTAKSEATDNDEKINYTEEQDSTDTPASRKKSRAIGARPIDTMFDFLELFIFTFVFVLLATSFIFRHSVVSGPSMMNTLQNGDKLIISDLFYEPEYRDIIVVQDYSAGITDPIVKRVIATEGQTVKITPDGVSVDGMMLDESDYIFTDGLPYSHLTRLDHTKFIHCPDYAFVPGSFCEFTVPEGELFVLGDHRNISQDSYFYGNVREDAILGKVIVRIYPNFQFFN